MTDSLSDGRRKNEFIPDNANILSEKDLDEYQNMRRCFFSDSSKSKKGERLELLNKRLNHIKSFIEKPDGNEWKRGIVCGIFFLKNSLAINIQALRTLLGKCKSSINGSLQQLGYIARPQTTEFTSELTQKIPLSFRHIAEINKWTMRVRQTPEQTSYQEPFIIELPESYLLPKTPETVSQMIQKNFPCPVKCRYKIYDIMSSIQLLS